MNEVILSLLPDYERGELDDNLDNFFSIAASSGVVLLPEGKYTEAKNGPYNLDDLLLPESFTIWKTSPAGYKNMADVYPHWFTWDGGKFDFSEKDLCEAFMRAHGLTRHAGDFYENGEKVDDADVYNQLLRSLSIVLKYAGGRVYSVFTRLKATCHDDAPPQRKRERLTRAIVKDAMNAMGYNIRFNSITATFEATGRTESGRAVTLDDLTAVLLEALAGTYVGVTASTLELFLGYVGREQRFNPVLDLLDKTKWDGVDRLPEVYRLLGIEDDDLSKTLVRKWLLQCVALLFNQKPAPYNPDDPDDLDDKKLVEPFDAEGVLVLNTSGLGIDNQGSGKTPFFRRLAMRSEWNGDGLSIDERDKDTSRRVVTGWITELGEVESTLKGDVEKLKAFLSTRVDRYRLPYGRSDIEEPRHTSLCATCNTEHFLVDPTGNRRFWTIPLNRRIPRDEIEALNARQLWAQIYAIVAPLSYKETAACFRLTEDEKHALAIRNGLFVKPITAQTEVEDIMHRADEEHLKRRRMTVTEFKTTWGEELHAYPSNKISAALKACGIELKHTNKGAVAELPVPPFHA